MDLLTSHRKISEDRLQDLLRLTQDDETGSELEELLALSFGRNCVRLGVYEIVLDYSKKIQTITQWSDKTPKWLKVLQSEDLEPFESAVCVIDQYYCCTDTG